jgi:hypothetical protein
MELFEFKDTFCCSLFNETKYNTSLKPNLLGTLFQNDVIIECKFNAKNNGKKQYIFSKQGIINSGCYVENNTLVCELATSNDETNFSDEVSVLTFPIEYDKKYSITYQIDTTNKIFSCSVNDEKKETIFTGSVSDYSNVPLWIGTSNPFVENKNYFNGTIDSFIVSNNEGTITDLDFSNVNRFKVWDKSGNGNYAYIEELLNKSVQIRLNKMIAGNSLETKDIRNIKQTLI